MSETQSSGTADLEFEEVTSPWKHPSGISFPTDKHRDLHKRLMAAPEWPVPFDNADKRMILDSLETEMQAIEMMKETARFSNEMTWVSLRILKMSKLQSWSAPILAGVWLVCWLISGRIVDGITALIFSTIFLLRFKR